MMILFCTLFLAVQSEAKDFGTVMDSGSAVVGKPDFDTRAFIQVRSTSEPNSLACTALHLEDKILLMSGKCADQSKKSLIIPAWRKPSYRAIEKASTGSDSIALVLVQKDRCTSLQGSEKHAFYSIKSEPLATADGPQMHVAIFGGTGFRFGGPSKEDSIELQVAPIDLKDGAYQSLRTVEIAETPVIREMITRRDGTLILDRGTGAILVQKDKNGVWQVGGVLTSTEDKIQSAFVSVRQEGQKPIEFEITEPESQWVDPSVSALALPSVQTELFKRGLTDKNFEISRSYQLSVTNRFTTLTDEPNREFLQKSLTELRRQRDEKVGCGRNTASEL